MTTKEFSPTLHAENDELAKLAAKQALPDLGLVDNPDIYGVDLLYMGGSVECERKKVWAGGPFPYYTVQVPYRKKHLFDNGAIYFLLAADNKSYLLIPPTSFSDSRVVEVANKYVAEGEKFYQIPLYECTQGVI